MTTFGVLLAVLAVGVSALVQIFVDPRITRSFIYRTLIAIALFAVQVALGIVVIAYLVPHGPDAALGVVIAFLGWLGLGTLGLIRFAPRLREPAAMLRHVGVADIVCLLMTGLGIGLAAGLVR